MAIITSETLQDIAVKCTEQFLNNKVPLSLGLAKEAADHCLNPDQIQRCVEATNTVAFLKVRAMSPDKTCEFPLAKYAEVMGAVSIPEDVEKVASAKPFPEDFKEALVKEASAQADSFDISELSSAESHVYFTKMAARVESRLSDLEVESVGLVTSLTKLAEKIHADPKGLDKMAQVMGAEYLPLSILVAGEPQNRLDVGDVKIFKDFETADAQELSRLYKYAMAVKDEKDSLRSDLTKAAEYSGLVKAAATAAFKPGVNVPKPPPGGQKGIAEKAINTGRSVMKGIGSKIPEVTPFQKALASGVAKATSVAASPVAKAVSVPARVVADAGRAAATAAGVRGLAKPGAVARAAGVGAGAAFGVGMNALMYNPGTDKTTGASRDVWSALE